MRAFTMQFSLFRVIFELAKVACLYALIRYIGGVAIIPWLAGYLFGTSEQLFKSLGTGPREDA